MNNINNRKTTRCITRINTDEKKEKKAWIGGSWRASNRNEMIKDWRLVKFTALIQKE